MSNLPGKVQYSRWTPKRSYTDEFSFSLLGRGVLTALVFSVILSLVASTIVYFTDLDERILFWIVNVGSFLVIGFASFLTSRKAGSHGLFYGVGTGAGYAVLTLLIGVIAFPPFLGVGAFLKRFGFSVVAGAAGGILGVNS